MRSRIALSRFAVVLTAVLCVGMFFGCVLTVNEWPAFITMLVLYLVLLVITLFFGALYIKADPQDIVMGSILRKRKIPMTEVESVSLFQPTMGAIRIWASGGFVGYWGLFKERDIGKYYAFYGKASDCFLVTLKNGKKYVLGCKNPAAMVDYINKVLQKKQGIE